MRAFQSLHPGSWCARLYRAERDARHRDGIIAVPAKVPAADHHAGIPLDVRMVIGVQQAFGTVSNPNSFRGHRVVVMPLSMQAW